MKRAVAFFPRAAPYAKGYGGQVVQRLARGSFMRRRGEWNRMWKFFLSFPAERCPRGVAAHINEWRAKHAGHREGKGTQVVGPCAYFRTWVPCQRRERSALRRARDDDSVLNEHAIVLPDLGR